jgi:hypothetical protein
MSKSKEKREIADLRAKLTKFGFPVSVSLERAIRKKLRSLDK